MVRRAVALGVGLVVLIIIVLGVKGCLDARAHRALEDYARNVSQILKETEQTSKRFFGNLEDPGSLSVNDFTNEVEADRSAMDNYARRIEGLSAPGDVGEAQKALKLVYELRSSAMDVIANKMKTALGDAGATKAQAAIATQMQSLLSSDVLYEKVVRPEINGVLEANGIDGSDVPKSTLVPDGIKWLEESSVTAALGAISGTGEATSGGVHGLGIEGTSVNGTELVAGGEAIVAAAEEFNVEVRVQNLGESAENGVEVEVSVNGKPTSSKIDTIAQGEVKTATIPVTPVPEGTLTLEVKVAAVPGEEFTENNEATYTVTVG
jgi:CARDB